MRVSSPPEERGTGAGLEDIIGGGDAPHDASALAFTRQLSRRGESAGRTNPLMSTFMMTLVNKTQKSSGQRSDGPSSSPSLLGSARPCEPMGRIFLMHVSACTPARALPCKRGQACPRRARSTLPAQYASSSESSNLVAGRRRSRVLLLLLPRPPGRPQGDHLEGFPGPARPSLPV
jgi:hypothetical protein